MANNRYEHSKDSVLDALINGRIYRIDTDNSIEIKMDIRLELVVHKE